MGSGTSCLATTEEVVIGKKKRDKQQQQQHHHHQHSTPTFKQGSAAAAAGSVSSATPSSSPDSSKEAVIPIYAVSSTSLSSKIRRGTATTQHVTTRLRSGSTPEGSMLARSATPASISEKTETEGPPLAPGRIVIRLRRKLDSGQDGRVYAAVMPESPAGGGQIAVKLIKKDLEGRDEKRSRRIERIKFEIRAIGEILQHRNIVNFVQPPTETETCFFLVFPRATKGDLLTEVNNHGRLYGKRAMRIAYDLIKAMAYAHSKGVIHGDLKPENILLTSMNEAEKFIWRTDERVMIADWGYSKLVNIKDSMYPRLAGARIGIMGSPSYAAPEMHDAGAECSATFASDVWSLGATLFAVTTRRLPFDLLDEKMPDGRPNETIARNLEALHNDEPEFPPNYDTQPLVKVICDMMAKSPYDRPSFSKLLAYECFSDQVHYDLYAADARSMAPLRGVPTLKIFPEMHEDASYINREIVTPNTPQTANSTNDVAAA